MTRWRVAALTAEDARQAWIDEGMPDDPRWLADGDDAVTRALRDATVGPGEILGVEQGFRGVLPDGLRLAGFADLVLRRPDGSIEVVDHKVTRAPRTPDELAGDSQLNLYGWFASRTWPGSRAVHVTHHYPLLGTTVTATLDPARMEAIVARLAAIAHTAEADSELAPTSGEHCGHCPWAGICDVGALLAPA